MVFQPVVELPGGALRQVEALARLRDGDRLIAPADFLSAFGDEELLLLFEIALEQSLGALEEWERDGVATTVSVNMPVISARDDRYLSAVRDALARHTVAPERLTLELLETGHVEGSLAARREGLHSFKKLGVRLAQDDSGVRLQLAAAAAALRLRRGQDRPEPDPRHRCRPSRRAPVRPADQRHRPQPGPARHAGRASRPGA